MDDHHFGYITNSLKKPWLKRTNNCVCLFKNKNHSFMFLNCGDICCINSHLYNWTVHFVCVINSPQNRRADQKPHISKEPWIKLVKDYKRRRVWIWGEANLIHLCWLLSLAHMFMTHHCDSLLILYVLWVVE